MSPGGHLVTTALACAAVQTVTGSAALTAGVAAGGFLIDLDHVLDYVAFERQRDLRPAAFLRYYLAGRTRTVVLLLHSYEVLLALALLAWGGNLEWLWGYVLGAAAVAGRSMVGFYSFVYRWRAGFRTDRLLALGRLAPPPARFWSAFFIGAKRQTPAAPRSHPRSARDSTFELLASPSAATRPTLPGQ